MRMLLIAVLSVIGIEGVVLLVITGQEQNTPAAPGPATPSGSAVSDVYCEGVTLHYGVHGTDCRSLPVVTAPGALGPANTGGPAGGTDWVQAYPGSNVWIPDYQISGRLFVVPAGSALAPPEGYEKIGLTPDGAALYWRPAHVPGDN